MSAGESCPPDDESLAGMLRDAFAGWQTLIEGLSARLAPITANWSPSAKFGWSLRLIRKKRTVVYLAPCDGYFLASFALGEKAVKAASEAGLPASVLAPIESAPRYAEGRGVRLEVRSVDDATAVLKLAEIKMAN